MGFLRRPKPTDHAALEQVDMQDLHNRQTGALSGGERKRVFLARFLAQGRQVILLDEPSISVGVRTEKQIVSLLQELRDEGRAMLVSTHNLGSVPEFYDRTVLVKGTVLGQAVRKKRHLHAKIWKKHLLACRSISHLAALRCAMTATKGLSCNRAKRPSGRTNNHDPDNCLSHLPMGIGQIRCGYRHWQTVSACFFVSLPVAERLLLDR